MQQEKRGCPLCGNAGHAARRQATVRKKKLVERVTMVCLLHEEATPIWMNFDNSITRYPNEDRRRKQSEAIKQHYARLDQRARAYAAKHPEKIGTGQFPMAADERVELSPTVKAIEEMEANEEERKKSVRRRIQAYGS